MAWKKRSKEHDGRIIIEAMRAIDRERRQRGIRQDTLCRSIGISTKTYAALLRGECNRLDVYLKAVGLIRS